MKTSIVLSRNQWNEYEVVKLVNRIEPGVGSWLKPNEVDALIKEPDLRVEIYSATRGRK